MPSVVETLVPRLTRLYPFYKGRGRLALSGLLRKSRTEPLELVRLDLLTGETIYVLEGDYIGRMVKFFGDLDPALSGLLRNLLRPRDVVLDVGANVGVVTLQVASIVGATGHVFAFEPIEMLSTLLTRSANDNQFTNVTVFNVALSDVPGRGRMKVDDRNFGCATLTSDSTGQPCEITMLDTIDFGPNFRRPRLLKIDAEGHESKVLAGGRRFLAQHPPEYVLFESHSHRGPFWNRPEVVLLREFGYDFAIILRNAFGRPILRKIAVGEQAIVHSYDYLATHRRFDV